MIVLKDIVALWRQLTLPTYEILALCPNPADRTISHRSAFAKPDDTEQNAGERSPVALQCKSSHSRSCKIAAAPHILALHLNSFITSCIVQQSENTMYKMWLKNPYRCRTCRLLGKSEMMVKNCWNTQVSSELQWNWRSWIVMLQLRADCEGGGSHLTKEREWRCLPSGAWAVCRWPTIVRRGGWELLTGRVSGWQLTGQSHQSARNAGFGRPRTYRDRHF